jgi:TRAP-type C4-dicarboxylate transport system permease small subunit
MKVRKITDIILSRTLIFIMAVMVVNVLWQVFTRFIMQSPSGFTDELARYLLIWVGLLGASYATGQNFHLSIDIIPAKADFQKQKYFHFIINIIVAAFAFFVMVVGGLNLVYITLILDQTSAALELPLAIVYSIVPISGLLIIFYSILNLFEKPNFGSI